MSSIKSLIGRSNRGSTANVASGATRKNIPRWLESLLGPAILVAAWELVVRSVPALKYSLGSPSGIVAQLWIDRDLYPPNIQTTVSEAALGFLIGNLLAIAIAMTIVRFPVLESGLMRIAVVTHAMPLLAIAPIITVVLVAESSKVALAALSVFFPTLIATLIGLRSADAAALDLVYALGGGSWMALRKVRLPASVPWILAGLKIAAPAAVLGAILGEFLGNDSGLGIAMVNAMATLNTDRVWGLALVSSLLSGGGFVLVAVATRVLVPWAPNLSLGATPAAQRRPVRGRAEEIVRSLGLTIISILGVLLLWEALLKGFNLNPFFAKPPESVVREIFFSPSSASDRLQLWSGLVTTIGDAGLGFIVGTLLAIAVAVLFVAYTRLERMFLPMAIALRSVPVIAMTPLLVLIFGRGLSVTLAISALFTFFTTLINVIQGLRSTAPQAVELMRALNASTWTVIWKVRLFSALPSLFASARISVLGSVLGAIVAEWLATGQGLGWVMIISRAQYEFDMLWAAGVLLTVVSAAVYAGIGIIETPVLRRYAPSQVDR